MKRKELIYQAIKRCEETIETCQPSAKDKAPVTDNDRKIAESMKECVAIAKGKKYAFEAVLSAMNGNSRMLNYYANG